MRRVSLPDPAERLKDTSETCRIVPAAGVVDSQGPPFLGRPSPEHILTQGATVIPRLPRIRSFVEYSELAYLRAILAFHAE